MLNINKLKAKIVESGKTQSDVAVFLNLSHATFNYKLNGKQEFKQSEIRLLCSFLEISKDEMYDIFFA